MSFSPGVDLLNELAKVLPIPMECRSLDINISCDSIPTVTIECILTDEQTDALNQVLTQYELVPLGTS